MGNRAGNLYLHLIGALSFNSMDNYAFWYLFRSGIYYGRLNDIYLEFFNYPTFYVKE
jgi:hypothetical protein